jgi:hypothetical protein
MGMPMVIVAKEVMKTSKRDFILKTLGEVRGQICPTSL